MHRLQRLLNSIPAPVLALVCLVVGAVALVGIADVAAWATNLFDSGLKITGDCRVTQDLRVTRDVYITDDLSVTDDCTFSDAVAVTGKATFADSSYFASKVTSASTVKADAVVFVAYTGALPDTNDVEAGYTVVRADTMYTRYPADDGWVTTKFE